MPARSCSVNLGKRKRHFQLKNPSEKWQRDQSHCSSSQYISNTSCPARESSAGRMIPALFAVAPCFPLCWAGGQASTTAPLAGLECPAAPSSLPGAWVTKAEGKRGKAWERKQGGREKQLILEISRKEAKSFNAPLVEILGKMGRSRAKLRDFLFHK